MHKTLLATCLAAATLPGLAHADEHYLRVGAGINELDSPDFDDDSNSRQGGSLHLGPPRLAWSARHCL